MTIETKFNVNDLVQYKYQKPNNKIFFCLEVIEIQTQACYAGTQVFYHCRGIHGHTDYEGGKREVVDFGPGFTEDREYVKFREDELKSCESGFLSLLNSEQKVKVSDTTEADSSNADDNQNKRL